MCVFCRHKPSKTFDKYLSPPPIRSIINKKKKKAKNKNKITQDALREYALHWIDQLSLYLEVFSFKLHAAWLDRPENYILGTQNHNKHNLHVCILYMNVIISYSFKETR